MATTRRYRILVQWQHRKWGPQMEKLVGEGTSIRRALSRALLAFFKDKSNRERRRDAHASIDVKAWRLKKETRT